MEENDYLCNMLKSEEKEMEALIAQLGAEKRARREAEKTARDAKLHSDSLKKENEKLHAEVTEANAKTQEVIKQTASMVAGNNGNVILGEVGNAIIEAVRVEFAENARLMAANFERTIAELKKAFELQLAAKDNEIARLKGRQNDSKKNNNDSPTSTNEELQNRINQLEQQMANLQKAAYGQSTESASCDHGTQNDIDADTLDLNGIEVPEEEVIRVARSLREQKSMKGVAKPRRTQPLADALNDVDLDEEAKKDEEDRDVVVIDPQNLPEDAVPIGKQETTRYYWVKGYFRVRKIYLRTFRDNKGNIYRTNLPEKYLNCMGHTSVTESIVALVLTKHFHDNMTLGDIEAFLKSYGLNFGTTTILSWIEIGARELEPLDEPLHQEILMDENVHSDESPLKACDRRLPKTGEPEEDVEPEEHYFKRWIFCHYSPKNKLTQFVFYKRGRRTREAEQAYLGEVMDNMKKRYLHSDGAALYKCYDLCELIVRVSCLVHIRRPFFKLKQTSKVADQMVCKINEIFSQDKQIRQQFRTDDEIRQQRCLRLAPLFNDVYKELERLVKTLDPGKEPELLKAVKYALKEFPCILHCLEDGSIELSNNCCERQIRRIAKYRNNSFTVGSVESAARFARLQSVFANIRNHKLNPMEYLCDVFRRIKNTAKEDLDTLLPHKWVPATVQ